MMNIPSINRTAALDSRSRDYRAFSLVKSTDLVADRIRAGGRTKDNAGILTAGETDGFHQRMQKEGNRSARRMQRA